MLRGGCVRLECQPSSGLLTAAPQSPAASRGRTLRRRLQRHRLSWAYGLRKARASSHTLQSVSFTHRPRQARNRQNRSGLEDRFPDTSRVRSSRESSAGPRLLTAANDRPQLVRAPDEGSSHLTRMPHGQHLAQAPPVLARADD